MSGNAVTKLPERQLGEAQQQPAGDLPSVVQSITSSLQQAIQQMQCEDLSCEISAGTERDGRSYARFSLRAYKRNTQVADVKG
jgi:hypothetical protein